MTTFARSTLLRPRAGRTATKLLFGLLAAAIACVVYATLAAPADAIVEKVESTSVGLQPRVIDSLQDGPSIFSVAEGSVFDPLPETFENPDANPVLHGSHVYLDFWDPTNQYHNDWKALIDKFAESINSDENGLDNVFAVDEQYTDISDQPAYNRVQFRGSYTDTTPYPTSGNCTDPKPLEEAKRQHIKAITCLTDVQIKTHLNEFIEEHKLPKGMSTVYYVLTPPGVSVCLDSGGASGHCSSFAATVKSFEHSFCSYHGDVNPGSPESGGTETILYGVLPWTAGGVGDGQLAGLDQTEAPECQDGGFNASEKEELEKEAGKERVEKEEAEAGKLKKEAKKLTEEAETLQNEGKEIEAEVKQQEAAKKRQEAEGKESFAKKDAKEKAEAERTWMLEGPHDEEPNQKPCPTADGYCDEGLADLIINQLAVEQQNIVTDPLLHSWQDSAGNEVTDECRNFFAPTLGGSVTANEESGAGTLYNQEFGGGKYYLNPSFNLAAERLSFPGAFCQHGVSLVPAFNDISPVEVGDTVGFDSGESIITLNAAIRYAQTGAIEKNFAKMTWNFGDGSPEVSGFAPGSPPCSEPWLNECAESVFHTYTAGGTYTVTLTVTDVGGNTASVTHEVTVIGPPPEKTTPPPPAPEGGGGTPSAGANTPANTAGSTGGGTTATGASVPLPVATAAVVSHSLKTALSKGVAVHYQVNEQVAGHFEVLLGQKMAKRLKIHGSLASNLPAGSEPEVVIGTALVVTLKGGGSTTHVVLTKSASTGLRKVKKVPLDLRLTVRNAAANNPATAVVMSAFTLKR